MTSAAASLHDAGENPLLKLEVRAVARRTIQPNFSDKLAASNLLQEHWKLRLLLVGNFRV